LAVPRALPDSASDSWRIVEAALDAVVSTDRNGQITRWNPQAERTFGWSAGEAMGRSLTDTIVPPRLRSQHRRGVERYLATGIPRVIGERIEISGLHRDGREIPIELSIVELTASGPERFTAFMRDLSQERRVEGQLARSHRERRALVDSVGQMQSGATVEQTAEGVCAAIRTSIAADVVAVMLGEQSGLLRTLASSVVQVVPPLIMGEMSPAHAAHVLERTGTGPWIELPGDAMSPGDDGRNPLFCTAYAPILSDAGGTIGVLLAASSAPGDRDRVTGWLPLVSDFAGVASALLMPHLRAGRVLADERGRLESIIAERRFASVFQPIVDMTSREITGYEALTRFRDESPNLVFARAAAIGLGVELELACLLGSLEAGLDLPTSSWLSLNVSPELFTSGSSLRDLVERSQRNLIFEITEGAPITDYAEMRAAIAKLGPSVQLAIDDAGAGYASLRHIIELRPSVVKLDIGLIRGVDADPIRQAMIAGIVHFANEIGCMLVGEGVETAEEAQSLIGLGVRMGQGYFFARPASIEELLPTLS
jgi:PAS domain S-box-containing protein